MKKLLLMALLLALLAAASLHCAAADNAAKVTERAVLYHTTSDYILETLGLDRNGKPLTDEPWNSLEPMKLPDGIDSLKWADTLLDRGLSITGTPAAVASMKADITKQDKTPTQISVKDEFFEVDPELAKEVGTFNEGFVMGSQAEFDKRAESAKALHTKLVRSQPAGIINRPIISVLDRVPAKTSVETQVPYTDPNTGEQKSMAAGQKMIVLARVNDDGTISIRVNVEVSRVKLHDGALPERTTHSLCTIRRIQNGEPFFLGGFTSDSGKPMIVAITPTIIRDTPVN